MTWTTELPTQPGWYYRRAVRVTRAEAEIDLEVGIDIVSIFIREWGHEPGHLCVEIFGEDAVVPVSDYGRGLRGDKFQYEFQPVKPPDE